MVLAVLEWLSTVLCIVTSFWRAMAWGHVGESYVVSGLAQVPFIARDLNNGSTSGAILNTFYLATSVLGYMRWRQEELKKGA